MGILEERTARQELGKLPFKDYNCHADRVDLLNSILNGEETCQVALSTRPKLGERIKDLVFYPLDRMVERADRLEIKKTYDSYGGLVKGYSLYLNTAKGRTLFVNIDDNGKIHQVWIGYRPHGTKDLDLGLKHRERVDRTVSRIFSRIDDEGRLVEA